MKRGLRCLVLLIGLAVQLHVADAQTRGPDLPSGVPLRAIEILQQARKTWRRDAIILSIKLNWSPQAYRVPPEHFWLEFELFSPSNRHRAFLTQLRGDDDGVIHEVADLASDFQAGHAVEDFTVDLPAAIAAARKAGMKDDISSVMLSVDEPATYPPVLAWVMWTAQKQFPFAVDAKTGKDLEWQQVLDPPRWTDEEMQQSMYRFIHRNDPPPPSGDSGGGGCFSGVEVMYGMCMDSGGGYVDPSTGH